MTIESRPQRTTLADLIRTGDLDDLRPYAPSGLCAGIDAEVAADSDCDHCGHRGLEFRGFGERGAWRGFAICPACQHAMEF